VRLFQGDGSVYGVGMPIIAYLSAAVTDARAFATATHVTVNGSPAQGAWFIEKSAIYPGYPQEAHYRLSQYWPAHASIHLDLPVKGLSAGTGLMFDNSLTLDMSTGPSNISTIDGHTERMVVTSDGKQVFSFPVSLGKASTPTFSGVKVLMQKDRVERMVSNVPGNTYDIKVPWSVRVTNSGEFIHAASWNGGNIGLRSTSHGCTNLNETDAQRFFSFAQVGDVANYTSTGGATMPSWDGYGDWNLPWSTWQAGGLAPTK
jgi:lipoprotein-anchoring transpeptidase ErfK/SrfK